MENETVTLTRAQVKALAAEARFISRALGRTVTPLELLGFALNSQSLANASDEISSLERASTPAQAAL